MRILILEDEHLVAESLKKQIFELEPLAYVEGPVGSIGEAKRILSAGVLPDLVIADIQLSDGISLDIFAEWKNSCPVIFTTAYNEYAIRAFKLNSVDYLLKPVDKVELKSAFDKYRFLQMKFGNRQYLDQLGELLGNLKERQNFKERFVINAGRNVEIVNSVDIAFFVKDAVIHLMHKNGRRYVTDYRSLDEIEELVDPRHFFRANRQAIIHLSSIVQMRSEESGKITVKMSIAGASDIIISKEKAAEFRRWIEGETG